MWSPARKRVPALPHLLGGDEGRTSTTRKNVRPPPLAWRLRGEDGSTKEILPFPELMRRCLMDGKLWSVEPGALIHH